LGRLAIIFIGFFSIIPVRKNKDCHNGDVTVFHLIMSCFNHLIMAVYYEKGTLKSR